MPLNFPESPETNDTYISGATTWQYDGTAWNIVSSVNPAEIPNAFSNISVSGQDAVQAEVPTDTVTFVGGTGVTITTNAETDTVTFTGSGGGGDAVTQNLFATIAGDTGSTTADSATDTLTIAGGTNVTTAVVGDTLTINSTATGGGGSSNFSSTDDASNASLSIQDIYLPAITKLAVDNVGASAYIFDQYTGNNPTIYALSGTTIAFDLTAVPGHPFEIQTPQGAAFNTGLFHVTSDGTVSVGAQAQGKESGVLYWKIPIDVNGGYRYQCTAHASMVGSIQIKNFVSI